MMARSISFLLVCLSVGVGDQALAEGGRRRNAKKTQRRSWPTPSPTTTRKVSRLTPAVTGRARTTTTRAVRPPMPKTIVYNDDGWSSYMRYPAPMSPEDVVRVTVGPVIGTGVRVYQFCALGGHAVNYNSAFLPRVGELMDKVDAMHVWRIRETLRHLEKLGTDPLHLVAKACHEHGIACQFSLRMNDSHHIYKRADGSWYFPELRSGWFDKHKQALLPNGTLDYAHADVHAYRKRQIQEVIEKYNVDGIDLDFTRFKPWFRAGQEQASMGKMTELVRQLRAMTKKAGKSLSARFEYDPSVCIASGLDVETMLKEAMFDHITLGVVGDHTPDAPADWWIRRAHAAGCKVYPGFEGQLHWLVAPGSGGTGTHPSRDGVHDGYGPPSIAYLRAVASVHYDSGADGISLFNFTCCDGPFDRAALTELADPKRIAFKDKQYVAAVWPWGSAIYLSDWKSRFRLTPGVRSATYKLRISDDIKAAIRHGYSPRGLLTMDLKGLNRMSDVAVRLNGQTLRWNGYHYNHYDHGFWNDVVRFDVSADVLIRGENKLELRRLTDNANFSGDVEVRKCILEVTYPNRFAPGKIDG